MLVNVSQLPESDNADLNNLVSTVRWQLGSILDNYVNAEFKKRDSTSTPHPLSRFPIVYLSHASSRAQSFEANIAVQCRFTPTAGIEFIDGPSSRVGHKEITDQILDRLSSYIDLKRDFDTDTWNSFNPRYTEHLYLVCNPAFLAVDTAPNSLYKHLCCSVIPPDHVLVDELFGFTDDIGKPCAGLLFSPRIVFCDIFGSQIYRTDTVLLSRDYGFESLTLNLSHKVTSNMYFELSAGYRVQLKTDLDGHRGDHNA